MTGGAACTNCGETLAGRYCHACGQDSIPPETALASWHGHWQRLWRTLYALVLRPGLLTREHLSGGRVRFIAPFTLFLIIVTIFFLFSVVTEFRLQSFVNKDTTNHIDRAINAFGLAVTFSLATAGLALASRRLFAERWPWAVGKGAAIVFVGFFLDNAMFLAALILTLNLT